MTTINVSIILAVLHMLSEALKVDFDHQNLQNKLIIFSQLKDEVENINIFGKNIFECFQKVNI